MSKMLFALGLMIASTFFMQQSVSAISLKVAPLEYRTSLKQGEKKKGFIDISNPTDEKLVVKTSAQAFRQIDDQGTIEFYDDEEISAGFQLDLDDFELGPKEAVRMYFQLDSTKLPSGDVYGAIFFTTTPTKPTAGVGQAIKLGTVLSVVNGTPGARQAAITDLVLPGFSFSSEVRGSYAVKNTADPKNATGFYPQVRLRATPFGETKEAAGKLVFAGRTRSSEFSLKLPPLGIYRVTASYGNSIQSKWVVVASPTVIVLVGLVAVALGALLHYLRRRQARGFRIK
jgi:hypothetical protein